MACQGRADLLHAHRQKVRAKKGMKQERRKKEQYDIETIHRSLTTNLQGLEVFVSNVAPIVRKHDRRLVAKIEKTSKEITKIAGLPESAIEEKKKQKIKLKLTNEQIAQIIAALKGLPRFLTLSQVELLYKSSFVMLMSYFDFLISDLIHYYYQEYPESVSGKELSITLNELKLCADLTEAIDYVVNKKIDAVLYGSLEDQRRYFENYLKIDAKETIIHWNKINEAMERRHIIVHNNGKINRRYLKNVDLSVIPEKTKDIAEGKKITMNEDYFMTVFDETLIAGIILIQCCWRQWRKDDIDNADRLLNRAMYDALSEEKWTVAERLGLFSKGCEVSNERIRLYSDINYYQSLKWQNKKDELERELGKFDISTLSPIYVLALCALRSDRDNFYKNVEKAIIVDGMEQESFMEWPLFRELREDPDYQKRIEAAFSSIPGKSEE